MAPVRQVESMKFYIQQSIHINILRINSMANSAIVQIGTSGSIRARSIVSNTGGFTEPVEPATNVSGFVVPSIETIPFRN